MAEEHFSQATESELAKISTLRSNSIYIVPSFSGLGDSAARTKVLSAARDSALLSLAKSGMFKKATESTMRGLIQANRKHIFRTVESLQDWVDKWNDTINDDNAMETYVSSRAEKKGWSTTSKILGGTAALLGGAVLLRSLSSYTGAKSSISAAS